MLRKLRRRVRAHCPLWARSVLARRTLARCQRPYKLNVGCGGVAFDGWVNVDIEPKRGVDLVWDATRRFPMEDGSCSLIYSEHFLEHLSIDQARAFLSECRRLLAPGGVLRIATPSLEYLVGKYVSDDWRDQEWLRKPPFSSIETRAEMVNVGLRNWGHRWLYDSEELHRRLADGGFENVRDVAWGASDTEDLRNRETRPDSILVCEARKVG